VRAGRAKTGGIAAGAVVEGVALSGLPLGVAGDLERVVAAGAADQAAQKRLRGDRTVSRSQQRLRRLSGVELGSADERLVRASLTCLPLRACPR
jgi:hypothetical protein